MFSQQQQRDKKIKSFLAAEAAELSLEQQQNLIEQLIIQTKAQINNLQNEDSRLAEGARFNDKLYRHLNVIKAFRNNTKDFVDLFNLWQYHSLRFITDQ